MQFKCSDDEKTLFTNPIFHLADGSISDGFGPTGYIFNVHSLKLNAINHHEGVRVLENRRRSSSSCDTAVLLMRILPGISSIMITNKTTSSRTALREKYEVQDHPHQYNTAPCVLGLNKQTRQQMLDIHVIIAEKRTAASAIADYRLDKKGTGRNTASRTTCIRWQVTTTLRLTL